MRSSLPFCIAAVLCLNANAQCPISQINTDSDQLIAQFGQSFEPQCTGRIQSISFDALAGVGVTGTLDIFEGDGVGGSPTYSQSLSLSISIGTNTINLDEPFEVFIKNQYTFELNMSATVQIEFDTGNPYANGQMYSGGSAVSGNDLVFSVTTLEVYPAAVSSNLALWLRADANTNTTTNGAAVTTWNDLSQSENNYTGAGSNSIFNDSFANGSPSITFNSNTAVLSTTETTYTDATLYVVTNHTNNSGSNDFFGDIATGDNMIRFEQVTDSDLYGFTLTSGTDYQSTLSSNHGSTKIFTVETINGTSTMNIQDLIDGTRRTDDFNVGATNRTLSNQDLGGFSDVAEVILYGGGVSSSLDRQKIESYLSIKYGLAYDQNLITSNNTTIWDATANASFDNDVAAIGRDDAASVSIKRSSSSSTDVIVTMENTGTFTADLSFISWGNDDNPISENNTVDVDGTLIESRMSRSWTVSEIGTVGNLEVEFDLTQVPGSKTSTDLRLLIDRDGDGFSDNDVLPIAGSLAGQIFTVSNVDFQDGDRFTVGSIDLLQTPLPIELVGFNGQWENNRVQLSWETASEVNNDYFTIEKSENAFDWIDFVSVVGAGNSNTLLEYTAADPNPFIPQTYYRLKQTDFDGTFSYSDVIRVSNGDTQIAFFPNPAKKVLTIQTQSSNALVVIRDLQGRSVLEAPFAKSNGLIKIGIEDLPPGIYVAELILPFGSEFIKFAKTN